MNNSPSPHRARVLLWIGGILCTAPLWGLGHTMLAMRSAMNRLAAEGSSDPAILANDISGAMHSTLIGLAVLVPGIILVIAGATSMRRAKSNKQTAPT